MSNERIVELFRSPGIGFGFSVIGGIDTHIPPMVCALVKNSPALLSGKIFVGDVLCKVNGKNVFNLETKEVVDLIRTSKETITLSLKEDRLAKLKARPFLAEDSLIDPPGVTNKTVYPQQQQVQGSKSFPRSVGSPKSHHYGTDGKFTNISSINRHQNAYGNSVTTSHSYPYNAKPSHNYHESRTANYEVVVYPSDSYEAKSLAVETKALVYDLDNLPRSPRDISSTYNKHSPKPTYKAMANHNKYDNNEYYSVSFKKSETTKGRSVSANHTPLMNGPRQSIPQSAPPYAINHTRGSSFDYSMGQGSLEPKIRPSSNPDFEQTYHNRKTTHFSESFSSDSTQLSNHNKSYQSTYSSPNVFEDTDGHFYQEGKNLSLHPSTYSVQSLDERNNFHSNDRNFSNDSRLPPLSLQIPFEDQSFSSSTTDTSPNLDISTMSESSNSTLQANESASPADIASRLFSLNGYQDKDVAPLLGKNTEFSQQVCREYLRFFAFDGLSLDEALRVFLQKFSLTGETQERERILIHFSKRYRECNPVSAMSEDAVHTLVCALMLLNTDLHGQSIQNKMSLNDFINNLSGLCDGNDFPRDLLKTLYTSIKSKEIVFSNVSTDNSNSRNKSRALNPANPFIELTSGANDAVLCEGILFRKSVMDSGGRRTPALKRGWRPSYCVLKGLVLFCYKPENIHGSEPHTIGIHHSLAGYAKDYKKRAHVFKLITSYWSVYYLQVKNQEEVRLWMDSLNMSAALLSAPPLPAPVGSSIKFQRPVMPVSRTKLSLHEQIAHHEEKVKIIEAELNEHMHTPPDPQSKYYLDWESKLDYLEFELKRFKAYVSVLTVKRLEPMRNQMIKDCTENSTSNTLPKAQKSNHLSVKITNSASHSSL